MVVANKHVCAAAVLDEEESHKRDRKRSLQNRDCSICFERAETCHCADVFKT